MVCILYHAIFGLIVGSAPLRLATPAFMIDDEVARKAWIARLSIPFGEARNIQFRNKLENEDAKKKWLERVAKAEKRKKMAGTKREELIKEMKIAHEEESERIWLSKLDRLYKN